MTKFHNITLAGSNTNGSKRGFRHRYLYKELYPDERSPKNPVPLDFWDQNLYYYGRIDPAGFPITANKSRMKHITDWFSHTSTATTPHYVFDFVADAFKFLQKYMHFGPPARKIAGSPWEGLKPKRAFPSILNDNYEVYLGALLTSYNDEYLRLQRREGRVLGMADYVKIFMTDYADTILQKFPITKVPLFFQKITLSWKTVFLLNCPQIAILKIRRKLKSI